MAKLPLISVGLGFCLEISQFDLGKAELEKQETKKIKNTFAARILHVIERTRSYQRSSVAASRSGVLHDVWFQSMHIATHEFKPMERNRGRLNSGAVEPHLKAR